MNYNELTYANKLYDEIIKIEKSIKCVKMLKDRALEISTEYQKDIDICIGERYVYTPHANVSKDRFIGFLDQEISELKLEMRRKEDELFAFSPKPYEINMDEKSPNDNEEWEEE